MLKMNTLLKKLMLGGSATALVAGASFLPALAQDTALDIETIQSSVSRIDLKGFEAPTPVTVVGIEQLNRDAKIQLGEQIRELPQVRGGTAISAGSGSNNLAQVNAGADTVSIRGLGASRNLVLFDRQRVVTSNIQDGTVDLSLIPSGLTQRVDVVTGGASAAWGSDAVTGVINIVINKTFEGFKGNVTYADNGKVSNPTYRASLAWGTSFLGGRAHLVAAADFVRSQEGVFNGEVNQAYGNNGQAFVYNSAYCNTVAFPSATATSGGTCASLSGQPLLVYAYGVGNNQNTVGGLINSTSAGTAGSGLTTTGLKGTMFVGEEATPTQFNYGTTYNSSNCYNGCTNDQNTGTWGAPAKQAYHSGTYFAALSYDILPDLKANLQLNVARLTIRSNGGNIGGNGRTIYADNPFLPQEIASRFVCNPAAPVGVAACAPGTTVMSNGYNPITQQNEIGALTLAQRQARPSQTLNMGFAFEGNAPTTSASGTNSLQSIKYSYDEYCDRILQNCGVYNKLFYRGAFALDGSIGDSWTWNAYIAHSASRIKQNIVNPLQGRFNNALDSVRVTAGNVGASGLPIGSIQCRALLNPSTASAVPAAGLAIGFTNAGEAAGCAPFNPFGDGEITNASRNYITPSRNPDSAVDKANARNSMIAQMVQSSAAFSMSGVLPWVLPAGEIGAAFGGEWRIDRHGQYKIDNRSLAGMYASGNWGSNFEGKQHAEEGFVELQIPVLKDNFVQTLSLDLGGRLTNYSNSGLVETWKVGLQSQIIDDLRFRATWSHDIRSPTIWDISAPGSRNLQNCQSFIQGPGGTNNGSPNQCYSVNGGNPTLNPERANTIAAGFVITPTFIDGLTVSIDWYQIHLKGGITTPGFADVINRCRAGEIAAYCGSLTFANGLPYPAGTTSTIEFVQLKPVNAGGFNTAGFDMNIAYGFDLFTGQMDVSFNGNYAYDFSRLLNGIYFQGTGGVGGYYSGGSEFQGTLNFNYREGAWSFGLQNRITGDALLNLGTQGRAGVVEQGVTYTRADSVITPTVSSGERNLITGAETNYQAYRVTTDVRVQYRWNNNITLFANVDNIQNLPFGGFTSRRSYRAGIRFNY
jgi:outer membrane receptor protein involved in Fe transport